ncbi:MAG: class I SAM-dependent methyltransferase [Patescibacteria group bacterium]
MKQFSRYQFKSGAQVVCGAKPAFLKLLVENISKDFVVLDLGCGSGELTTQLSRHCKRIIGIDCFANYIKTANKDKKNQKIENVLFKVQDGRKLSFKDEMFDVVYSSRGPVSANSIFFKEALRVLKKDGLLIEETIGETDKIELKKIFNRGQNFPYFIKKRESVQKLFDQFKLKKVLLKDFVYHQKFSSLNAVVRTLERTPIIADFDKKKDTKYLAQIELMHKKGGIILRAHRLWWIAKKI